jgi:alkylation response protein AidB-like acyl-CoA dehydrogenase
MDLNLTEGERRFRDELRAWLAASKPEPWHGSLDDPAARRAHFEYLRTWQRTLFQGGWAGVAWPREYGGRGATMIEQAIFLEELARADAPERLGTIGEGLVGPTIIALGSEEQKRRFPPAILSGEHIWCQGYSEPNAGSDLAALGTRAVRSGEEFLVNGQKIWTSYAHLADWCMLLVRTNLDVPKHKGLTCLLVDMKSEGITVRPLRMMSGDSGFNEIFFTNVRVPVANVLGPIDAGWTTAMVALSNERANLGTGLYVVFKRDLDALSSRARATLRRGVPLVADALVRQKLAQAEIELEVFRLNILRSLSRSSRGASAGPEGSMLKIYWSEMNQRIAQTALEVLGPEAQQWDFDRGRWAYQYLRSRGNTIEAGTSEVQRNILAQRVLGLPRSY